jgi:hypothetical protein
MVSSLSQTKNAFFVYKRLPKDYSISAFDSPTIRNSPTKLIRRLQFAIMCFQIRDII